jgi:hypothetical protein
MCRYNNSIIIIIIIIIIINIIINDSNTNSSSALQSIVVHGRSSIQRRIKLLGDLSRHLKPISHG